MAGHVSPSRALAADPIAPEFPPDDFRGHRVSRVHAFTRSGEISCQKMFEGRFRGLHACHKLSRSSSTPCRSLYSIRGYKNSDEPSASHFDSYPASPMLPKFRNDGRISPGTLDSVFGKEDARAPGFSTFQKGEATGLGFVANSGPNEREGGRVGQCMRQGNSHLASFQSSLVSPLETDGRPANKEDISKALSRMLPYTVLATAVIALLHPPSFSWFSKKYYAPALGGIMLSIGVQLTFSDFYLVFQRPLPVLLGYFCQYFWKPVIALAVVSAFGVPPAFSTGLLLTASVAGAQLSSYAAYLANGDVALSIVLTSLTTVSSVVATPILTQLLIGSLVPIDLAAMACSILQVVIFPVALGLILNTYAKDLVDRVRHIMPLIAMTCTSLCIGSPLSLNSSILLSPQGARLLLPVVAFHVVSFTLGYWFSKLPLWRQDEKVCATLSLCTGMQSSTLAMLLASQFLGFSQTVPAACSVVVMALMGLSMGAFWGTGGKFSAAFQGIRRGSECPSS